jgi:hypothetical protein
MHRPFRRTFARVPVDVGMLLLVDGLRQVLLDQANALRRHTKLNLQAQGAPICDRARRGVEQDLALRAPQGKEWVTGWQV